MKAVLQLFFIIFYAASVYGATQIKTVDLLQNLRHANARSEDSTIEPAGSNQGDNLPRYREAKKAPNDFQCHPVWEINVAPTQTAVLPADGLNHRLHFRLPPSHSRAPPPQS